MRILSLHPAATELVFALGAGHMLVGRTDACDYPEAALKVPSIGNDAEAMQQAVAIFEPDVILLGKGQESFRSALGPARKATIFAPKSTAELILDIKELADQLGKQVEADLIIHDLQATFERVQLKCSKFKTVKVFWEQQHPMIQDALIAELVTMAGGEPYREGQVLEFNPYYVLAIGKEEKYAEEFEPNWKNLPAVQNERILFIEEGMLRPTPRIAQGAKQLAKLLHGVDVSES